MFKQSQWFNSKPDWGVQLNLTTGSSIYYDSHCDTQSAYPD